MIIEPRLWSPRVKARVQEIFEEKRGSLPKQKQWPSIAKIVSPDLARFHCRPDWSDEGEAWKVVVPFPAGVVYYRADSNSCMGNMVWGAKLCDDGAIIACGVFKGWVSGKMKGMRMKQELIGVLVENLHPFLPNAKKSLHNAVFSRARKLHREILWGFADEVREWRHQFIRGLDLFTGTDFPPTSERPKVRYLPIMALERAINPHKLQFADDAIKEADRFDVAIWQRQLVNQIKHNAV